MQSEILYYPFFPPIIFPSSPLPTFVWFTMTFTLSGFVACTSLPPPQLLLLCIVEIDSNSWKRMAGLYILYTVKSRCVFGAMEVTSSYSIKTLYKTQAHIYRVSWDVWRHVPYGYTPISIRATSSAFDENSDASLIIPL